MNRRVTLLTGLAVLTIASPAFGGEERFQLPSAIPADAFLCVAGHHNPERGFLDEYWGEVIDALAKSGIDDDVIELIGSLLGEQQQDEAQRLRDLVTELLEGVDWDQLGGGEMAFAERMRPLQPFGRDAGMGPPGMVFLFRGSGAGVDQNHQGLTKILRTLVAEINTAAGSEKLTVETYEHQGAEIAGVNLLSWAAGAPEMDLSVGRHDDVLVLAFGKELLHETLALLHDPESGESMADNPRFIASFKKLPPAEDSMVFFDMQNLLQPIHDAMQKVAGELRGSDDVYLNTGGNLQANTLNQQAIGAYQRGDHRKALDIVRQAHDEAPDDSLITYNVACFSALVGEKQDALDWLEKAVEAGFYAPGKIASDSDFESLRGEPRFKAAVERAAELAALHSARDIVINSSKTGECYKLSLQAWQLYEQEDYEQGLKLVEQAHAVAPNDSRALYYLACFHSLLDHQDKALDFLEQAVAAGFYCPKHITRDKDLESIRSDKRYDAALSAAREKAATLSREKSGSRAQVFVGISDRIMNAVSILDYVATAEYTDGHSVHTDSIAALVPDAQERPFYRVIASGASLADFDRYLPRETESFSVSGGFNPGALYDFLLETVRAAGPPGQELLDRWTAWQAEAGVNIQKDLISWVGGEFVSITLADDAGSIWLMQVTDEQLAREKIAGAIEKLSEKMTELAVQNPMLGMLAIETEEITGNDELEGFQALRMMVAPTSPLVWGVSDQHLIFGTSEDTVALCLRTARGEHPNIRENARAMSEMVLPDGPCVSVRLTDQRRMGEQIAEVLAVIGPVSGMIGMAIPDPQARQAIAKVGRILMKLGPVARKIDFFKSSAAYTTFDGHAWLTRAVTHYASPEDRTAATGP